ncbi:hypothetical protein LOTGIDRAFT_161013 [Lottia gigantea]|uniref:Uncharacterized protein n=1 Tax=Lottia gigantea TaxID=225164 RepID=V4C019_LOTGI|nr:hypothetical protein LOTGIDRAFT_161013 [Lottia gigantea]ESO94764.1 hypothetical protein LOTGIDRAFT_161013 [Lottia gigantea]
MVPTELSPIQNQQILDCLSNLKDLFVTEDNPGLGLTHLVQHKIQLKDSAISKHQGPYRLPPNKKEVLRHQLDQLLEQAKQKLFNGIIDMFMESGDKFPVVLSDKAIGDQVIMPLTNGVWYLSGNMGTIQERAKHLPDVHVIPARFLSYDNINDYKKKKER